MSYALDILLFATGWGHVLLAPYTKVEESFNLHATHDVLMYGVHPNAIAKYDHNIFPGAVPRTFIGSVLLAWLSQPFLNLMSKFDLVNSKFDLQVIVRLVLASVNAIGLSLLRRAVSRRFGFLTGFLWVLLTCTQFHLPFWMGRTLPNMFALFPVNIAFYLLLDRKKNARKPAPSNVRRAIALLTFAGVVFRSEIALLLAPVVLQSFRLVSPYSAIKIGLASAFLSIVLTIAVDSYFWATFPLWPELSGAYFNVYQGKSSEWGVSPLHTYFLTYLPKLLLSSAPLSILGTLVDSRIRSILFSAVTFVALISGLGHKEWRFIIYAVPIFNVAAARGAWFLMKPSKTTLFGKLAFLLFIILLSGNCLFTYVSTVASVANYPGGAALTFFNAKYAHLNTVHVHISNLAAQSGASLFLQTRAPPVHPALLLASPLPNWTYNKTENLPPIPPRYFTHLVAEYSSIDKYPTTEWTIGECISGFDSWALNLHHFMNSQSAKTDLKGYLINLIKDTLQMRTSKKLCILERRS